MSDCLCEIQINDIDLSDERYKIFILDKDIGFLARSIVETGLVCPPIVRPVNSKLIIVSGFNRIKAHIYNNHRFQNKKKIVVYKTTAETTDYQCLLKAITSLSFQRMLTPGELIACIKRLHHFLNTAQIAEKSPAIFNTELPERFVKELLTIGALPDPALELVHTGNLSLKSARRIALFETETIMVFLTIFSKIYASHNKQLEIILYIMEICARDNIKPRSFLQKQAIQDILINEKTEPGLKTTLLRAYLFELRFPMIFNHRQQVMEKIGLIKFGNHIKFSPPENLDSQDYTISFTAKNYEQFLTNVQTLNKGLENRELRDLFNP